MIIKTLNSIKPRRPSERLPTAILRASDWVCRVRRRAVPRTPIFRSPL